MKVRWCLLIFAMLMVLFPVLGAGEAVRLQEGSADGVSLPPQEGSARGAAVSLQEGKAEGAAALPPEVDVKESSIDGPVPLPERGATGSTGSAVGAVDEGPGRKENGDPVPEEAVPDDRRAAVVLETAFGRIDWTAGVMQAEGKGVPEKGGENEAGVRALALRAATLDASRRLLALARSVRTEGTATVADFAAKSDLVLAKIEDMIRGAKVVRREYLSDGTVVVTLALPLYGGFSQLVLPPGIQQIEPVRPIYAKGATAIPAPSHTGMVVDVRGLRVMPSLSPRIVDERGREVYGAAFVSREFAVQNRVSGYVRKTGEGESFGRAGEKPLFARGLRVAGEGRTDVVISNADAERLMEEPGNIAFMRECKVVMVLE